MEKMNLKTALKAGFKCNDNGYFNSFLDNVYANQMDSKFQKMFNKGSGNELHSKAEAIHSSSMLAYNFFHWIDDASGFDYNGINYTNVFFEVRMKTLKNSNSPANMDIVLSDKEHKHLLFIESKFTEYCETKKWDLSDSYKNENSFNNDVRWDEIIKEIKDAVKSSKSCKYKDGIKQLTTHLFGIANLCNDKDLAWFNDKKNNILQLEKPFDVKFINLVFEPQKENFNDEHDNFDKYRTLLENVIKIVDNKIKMEKKSLKIEFLTYTDLWNLMKNQIDKDDLKDYLWQRYMQFAEGAER